MANGDIIPTVTFRPARTGATAKANELGMRPMQARAYDKRGEQFLLINVPRQHQWHRFEVVI